MVPVQDVQCLWQREQLQETKPKRAVHFKALACDWHNITSAHIPLAQASHIAKPDNGMEKHTPPTDMYLKLHACGCGYR